MLFVPGVVSVIMGIRVSFQMKIFISGRYLELDNTYTFIINSKVTCEVSKVFGIVK